MTKDTILIIGASGQIGTDLTMNLRAIYGDAHVIASDIKSAAPEVMETGPFEQLDIMNEYFQKLNNTVEVVCREISKTNDYLSLLNTTMYDMKLSVDETNLNLQDISNSIEKGNMMLEKGNNLLDGIKSGVGLNNLLTGIQTYQMYRINKNTKSLRE